MHCSSNQFLRATQHFWKLLKYYLNVLGHHFVKSRHKIFILSAFQMFRSTLHNRQLKKKTTNTSELWHSTTRAVQSMAKYCTKDRRCNSTFLCGTVSLSMITKHNWYYIQVFSILHSLSLSCGNGCDRKNNNPGAGLKTA